MKKVGIVCEYNLFHNGHLKQLQAVHAYFGECAVISVMSGNYSQRGEPCALPKYIRAKSAVEAGADIVLELPFPWSCSVAERFALAGVSIIAALNCDYICFGSESGELERLKDAADILSSPEFETAVKRAVKVNPDIPFPKLRSQVYEIISGEPLPDKPNDILGVEYLRAVTKLGAEIEPFIIRREGGFTATEARRRFMSGESLYGIVPDTARAVLDGEARSFDPPFDGALLNALRSHGNPPSDIARRICTASRDAVTRAQLYELAANAGCTSARIRREAIGLFTGVGERDVSGLPRFTTLLAARSGMTALLKDAAGIEIVTKPADYASLSDEARRQFQRSLDADDLYSLLRNEPPSENLRRTPYIKGGQ